MNVIDRGLLRKEHGGKFFTFKSKSTSIFCPKMFEKLSLAMEKAKNSRKGCLNVTSEEIESLVCPIKFNSDECIEIMCRNCKEFD